MKKISVQEKENLSQLLLSPERNNTMLGFEILKNYSDVSSEWNKELVLIWQLHDEYPIKMQAKAILKKCHSQEQLHQWENGFKVFNEIHRIITYTDEVRQLLDAHENIRKEYQPLMEFNSHFCLHYYALAERLHLEYEKHLDLAAVYYRIVLQTNPNHKDNLFDFARLLACSPNTYQEAIKLYLNVAQINPKSAMSMNNIGVIYANRKEFQNAYKYFQKALYIDSNLILAMSNLSRLYASGRRGQEEKAEAIALFEKLTQLEVHSGIHWDNWAIYLWIVEKDYDEAKDIYIKGLTHAPKNSALLGNLGELYIDIYGEYTKGLELYRKALEIELSSYRLMTTITVLVLHFDHVKEAIKYYKDLVELSPSNEIVRDTSFTEEQWENFLSAEKVLLSRNKNKEY